MVNIPSYDKVVQIGGQFTPEKPNIADTERIVTSYVTQDRILPINVDWYD